MQHRKRLLRVNRKPLDSFEQASPAQSAPSNVIETIHNQNLYLKLVGIALEMSRGAGVNQSILRELQSKLLAAKGFHQFSMLNQTKKKLNIKHDIQNQNTAYISTKKYITPQEQLSFLNRLQKQTVQAQTKQHIIYALKKYIEQKKKTIYDESSKSQVLTRGRRFIQKIKQKTNGKKICRSTFYGQSIRQILGRIQSQKSHSYETIRRMVHLKTLWGHTFFTQSQQQYCPVYNVIFDNTQKIILTGGQDGKIKVWSRESGALIKTLQGHKDYINKICMTKDNKMVLSAGQDGVRFFDLDNMSSLGGYGSDCIMDIGQVPHKDSSQTSIIFANATKLFVIPSSTIKSQSGRKLQCYDFKIYNFGSRVKENTNANTMTITEQGFIFLGFIEGQILIFNFNNLHSAQIDTQNFGQAQGMQKVPEFVLPVNYVLNAHQGDILQITWNPILYYFTTGAKKDGVCKIWEFKHQESNSRPTVIKQLRIPKHKMKRKKKIYNCNFCCWNSTFTHVTCSYQQQQLQEQVDNRGDGQVLVYNAMRGQITWQMSKNIQLSSIRALDCHPFYSNIMLVCDSYGKIMVVDIYQNYIINIFEQRAFHLGHPSFCLVPSQCRFSQDGLHFLVSTQYGNFSIYGYDIKQFYHLYPTQQFFTNDYSQFFINNQSLRPVVSVQSNYDINLLNNGQLQNIRHFPYDSYAKIDPIAFRHQIQYPNPKQQHKNLYQIDLKQVQRMYQLYLQRDRHVQIIKKNIQQIQNKRMSILYYQRESRAQKLKQIVQQKSQKMRQIDQNIVANIFSTDPNMPSRLINQVNESPNEGHQQTTRRRGRRSTRNMLNNERNNRNSLTNYVYNNVQADSNEQENVVQANRQDQQQYNAENQSEEFAQSGEDQELQDEDDDFHEQNQSDQAYMTQRTRRQSNLRRRQRDNHNNNRNRLRRNQGRNSGRRRRPSQQIEQLENEFEEHLGRPRKRIQQSIQQQDQQQQVNQQSKKQLRKTANRNIAQIRQYGQQSRDCNLCLFKQATVHCYQCQQKYYCDSCHFYRGKKLSQSFKFICFQCYFNKNLAPQMHKNISYQKYILPNRSDLFVPQIGDQVAYFFQGYQQFLYDKIQILNNKYIELGITFDIIPHEAHPQIINIQKCTVTDISYAFPLEQQTHLQLNYKYKSNPNRGRARLTKSNLNLNMNLNLNIQDILTLVTLKTGSGLTFRVFHFPGYQFLLKWEIYDDIMKNDRYGKFKLYDIVRIKDEQIQIMQIRPLNSAYNNSIWKNIIVHKAQNKYLRRTKDKNDDIAINIWNIDGFIDPKAFQYHQVHASSGYKPMKYQMRQHYKQRIIDLKFSQQRIWDIFYQFVDIDIYPHYNQYVQVGICLRLIIQRLQNNYYSCQQSFKRDLDLLIQNSVIFNGKQSEITDLAERLVRVILQREKKIGSSNGNSRNLNGNSNDVEESGQNDHSTQRRTKARKKLQNSGSSARQQDQYQQKNTKKKQIRVSKFQDQIIDIQNKSLHISLRDKKDREKQRQRQRQVQKDKERQRQKIKKQKQKQKERERIKTRRRKSSQQSQDYNYKQYNQQEDDQYSQSVKPVTRSKRRMENQQNYSNNFVNNLNHNYNPRKQREKQRNQNCRVTRSRTKN